MNRFSPAAADINDLAGNRRAARALAFRRGSPQKKAPRKRGFLFEGRGPGQPGGAGGGVGSTVRVGWPGIAGCAMHASSSDCAEITATR